MRQFGTPIPDARRRPGAYAVIHDAPRGLVLVRAGGPLHLPGGGIEAGEDGAAAVVREVAEETGMTVEVVEPLGTVLQAVDHLNKVSSYFSCRILAEGGPHEADHELVWDDWPHAMRTLVLESDRFAIAAWATRQGYDIA